MRTSQRRRLLIALFILFDLALAAIAVVYWFGVGRPASPSTFSGDAAMTHVTAQLALGPRITGTEAGRAAGDYILNQLAAAGWAAEFQDFEYQGTAARNVIGRANVGSGPVIIVGAHYDTRKRADQDANDPAAPVPGANDGASGVAVVLELARALDLEVIPHEIWLVFFDAEDNGRLDGWDWIAGSRYLAAQLTEPLPQAMILFDMIGDADQQIYFDTNSHAGLSAQLWQIAAQLGYSRQFIPLPRYAMLDDHTPFAQLGIPAVDIIDFDYPYWHTTADTADKLSAESLQRVGRTVEAYLENREP
ncbi:MAG: M28 family peptidase [Anaerolineales bacterium]|nr:M28 family peptidase [Anaerolineales bacterium]